jgi:hypothetical protein
VGREQHTGEIERERVCERQSVAGNENSVSNKIDHWQKIFMADVGD